MEKTYLVIVAIIKRISDLMSYQNLAAQSTLIIDDSSSCKFIKINKTLMLKKY